MTQVITNRYPALAKSDISILTLFLITDVVMNLLDWTWS